MTFGLGSIQKLNPRRWGSSSVRSPNDDLEVAAAALGVLELHQPGACGGGHIDGILFLQGESDATNKDDAGNWAKRFKVVLTASEPTSAPTSRW